MSAWEDLLHGMKQGAVFALRQWGINLRQPVHPDKVRARLGRLATSSLTEAEMREFLATKNAKYEADVAAERARGNKNHPTITYEDGWIGDYQAVIVYNQCGEHDRVDIYYGGIGGGVTEDNWHGHVLLRKGVVVSWEEPGGTKGERRRLY